MSNKKPIVWDIGGADYQRSFTFEPCLAADGAAQVRVRMGEGAPYFILPDTEVHAFVRAVQSAFNDACEMERLERESREAAAYAEGRAA